MRAFLFLCCIFSLSLLDCSPAEAQEQQKKQQGPPPMLVEVAEISEGDAEPTVERIGTIRYARVSRVATEVPGIVEKLFFTEGSRVKKGQKLVQLKTDLLVKAIEGTRASYEQVLVEQERASKELARIKALYDEKSVSESIYDDNYYKVLSLEKRADNLKSILEKQQLELKKTTISAPFNGLIQKKNTEQGEWVTTGGQVALIADDQQLEVEVDIPQQQLDYLVPGRMIPVRCSGEQYSAEFAYVIPRGDVSTRTFTVKLKLRGVKGLIEGMEAFAQFPNGIKQRSLLAPRDAVIKQFGQEILFVSNEGKAKMIPVKITGYQEMQVAIEGQGLSPGMQVVIKGNERIRDGQAIRFNQ